MCGIAGVWRFLNDWSEEELKSISMKMASSLHHRGPDASDNVVLPRVGIALAHTRLSIIDTTSKGSQPMVSSCGNYVIVYNGEVYNAIELRKELIERGAKFRGESDTEVLIEAISKFGVEKAVKYINGMFAFAVYDKKTMFYGWPAIE